MIGQFGLGLFGARADAVPVRVLAAMFALGLLSACADTNMGSLVTPAAAPAAQSDATTTAAAATPPPPARAAPAGRSAQGAPVPQTTPRSLTPEQINGECWMSIESNKKVRDIDQRLKLVDKCVEERTKGK
jgi:hypothetical protein